MKVSSLKIPDLKLIEMDVFEDNRGFFYESFNQQKFNEVIGQEIIFVQDNYSKSKKGVLRGLHFQKAPFSQGKLVQVLRGDIFDVVVDVRKDSKTFSKWLGISLNDKDKKQLWIPSGFAHGFMVTSQEATISYKVTNYYRKEYELTISHDDKNLSINWPRNIPKIISDKDMRGIPLEVFRNLCEGEK